MRSRAKGPAFTGLRILRRIIVIDRECVARDSARSARRKLAAILAAP
jgi:hypothetical protein